MACVFFCVQSPKLVQSRGGKLVPKGGVQSYLLYLLAESSWSHVRSWPIWQWKRQKNPAEEGTQHGFHGMEQRSFPLLMLRGYASFSAGMMQNFPQPCRTKTE